MKQHLLKDGSPGTPLSEGCGAEPGVSERARDGRGAPRAVGPLAPARLLQGCTVQPLVGRLHAAGALASRAIEYCTSRFLLARSPRPWSAASRNTSADSRCASGGERIITVPITV